MLKSINKLIEGCCESEGDVYKRLKSIAKKLQLKEDIDFIVIDVEELSSMTRPKRNDSNILIGNIKVDL
jgi:hypothetical protein